MNNNNKKWELNRRINYDCADILLNTHTCTHCCCCISCKKNQQKEEKKWKENDGGEGCKKHCNVKMKTRNSVFIISLNPLCLCVCICEDIIIDEPKSRLKQMNEWKKRKENFRVHRTLFIDGDDDDFWNWKKVSIQNQRKKKYFGTKAKINHF